LTFWFFRFLDWARRTAWLMTLVVLTCLAVGGWGFYDYYGLQFEWIGLSHWYVFPFVADCPLFVYFFVVGIGLHYLRRAHPAFTAFAAIGNIKYGIWTVFVLLYYYDRFFGPGGDSVLRAAILALHVGMVPLGLVLWRTLPRMKAAHLGIATGVLLVFDYVDYFFTRDYQIYPIGLPNHGVDHPYTWQELGLVPWFTIAETLGLAALMWYLNVAHEPHVEPAPAAQPEQA
jgi:uncharacterized membrane protein YpjA